MAYAALANDTSPLERQGTCVADVAASTPKKARTVVTSPLFLHQIVANLDIIINKQLVAILNHPRFQALEALWRNMAYLVTQIDKNPKIKIRILNISKKELASDLKKSLEFDQSQLFHKIYNEEFGMPGGKPFGVLIGDYEFSSHPKDIETLQIMAQIAAAAFVPFITAASAATFSLDNITELAKQPNLEAIFKQPQYVRWNSFREQEDSRFIGLTLPHVLVREPYTAIPNSQHLWGNASFAFAAVLIQAFDNYGWLGNIRGFAKEDVQAGGIVTENVLPFFMTDQPGLVPKLTTDVLVTDSQEKQLSDLGFIPLCHAYGSDTAVFYSNSSVQKPKAYNNAAGTQNALTSTMLQHLFCASRFAHYLKVMGRDKVGSFLDAGEYEGYLNNWLTDYIASNSDLAKSVRMRYPLQEANVQVKETPGKPGSYRCLIHLRPYFQLEQVVTSITLVTELVSVANV